MGTKVFFRMALPIIFAVTVIICCIIYLNHDSSINSGETDVLYNDIVYARVELSPNARLSEDNSKYSGGDYKLILDYGQERLLDVRVLNDNENLLYSAIHVWVKPGYEPPTDFGEEFSAAYYVVAEGHDALVVPDEYVENVNEHLADFDTAVKLEDIVASEPTDIAEYTERGIIRFNCKNHADISFDYALCEADGKYYLNVMQGSDWTDTFFEIKAEYVGLLTSAMQ